MTMSFAGQTAVAGIGATEFSKDSGRSTLRLAVEACDLALQDAGLDPKLIDGMVTFTVDENHEIDVARSLGIPELSHFSPSTRTGRVTAEKLPSTVPASTFSVARDAVEALRKILSDDSAPQRAYAGPPKKTGMP